MPLKPNFIERLLIHSGIIPSALLDVGISMFQSSAVLTAGDIKLFNHLKDSSLTLEELCAKTGCSSHGLQVLLICMLNLGYLKKNGDNYSLSKAMQSSFPIDLLPDMFPFFRPVNEKLNSRTMGE